MGARGSRLAAALAVAVAVLAPSTAEARTRRDVRITQTVAVLSVAGGGAIVHSAGANAGSPGGHGAVTGRTTVANGVFRTVFTNYYEDGTFRAVSHLRRGQRPDGSTTFTGTGTFVGGTGRFVGARGRFRVRAGVPAGSNIGTFRLTGIISY